MKKNILFREKNKISKLENIFGIKNKKNKGFTLVEMVIVVLIIGIMLTVTLSMSWSQITRLQFKLDKETFVSSFQKIQTTFLSSNYSVSGKASIGNFSLVSGDNFFNFDYGNGKQQENLGLTKIGSLFFLQNSSTTSIASGNFIFSGYKIGCGFQKNLEPDILTSGVVKVLLARNSGMRQCISINLQNCRLVEEPILDTSDYCQN